MGEEERRRQEKRGEEREKGKMEGKERRERERENRWWRKREGKGRMDQRRRDLSNTKVQPVSTHSQHPVSLSITVCPQRFPLHCSSR